MGNLFEKSRVAAIPLEELIIPRPPGPVYLNLLPYEWVLDDIGAKALRDAVNYIRHDGGADEYEPRALEIKCAEDVGQPSYDFASRTLRAAVSLAKWQPDVIPETLAQEIEYDLSRKILTAIHQAHAVKTMLQKKSIFRTQDISVLAREGYRRAAKTKPDSALEAYFDEPPILLLNAVKPPTTLWARRPGQFE